MTWNDAISKVESEIIRLTKQWGNPCGSPYEQGAQDHGNRLFKAVKDLRQVDSTNFKSVLGDFRFVGKLTLDLADALERAEKAEKELKELRVQHLVDLGQLTETLERAKKAEARVEKAEKELTELQWMMDGLRK